MPGAVPVISSVDAHGTGNKLGAKIAVSHLLCHAPLPHKRPSSLSSQLLCGKQGTEYQSALKRSFVTFYLLTILIFEIASRCYPDVSYHSIFRPQFHCF